ncbi:hypothetical protein [Marisediminicola sp. LYQ134]|uniref:hypothetical protein n=1 Tax=Marisediminicola sp. LYQ134 TaxID=3391061 RepID=UPI0039838C12
MPPFLDPATRDALQRLAESENAPPADAAEPPSAHAALARVRDIRTLAAALESEPAVIASVRDALEQGATWDDVAAAATLRVAAAKWRWQGTDADIAERHAAGRKRAARPSSKPSDLPGHSVADAARLLGVTAQAVYLRITRGTLRAETITLDDGRSYKRVFLDDAAEPPTAPSPAQPTA